MMTHGEWAACSDGTLMLAVLGTVSGPPGSGERRPLVLAACECARLALPEMRDGVAYAHTAIETAVRWANGEGVSLQEVQAAARAAARNARVDFRAAIARAHASYAAASSVDYVKILLARGNAIRDAVRAAQVAYANSEDKHARSAFVAVRAVAESAPNQIGNISRLVAVRTAAASAADDAVRDFARAAYDAARAASNAAAAAFAPAAGEAAAWAAAYASNAVRNARDASVHAAYDDDAASVAHAAVFAAFGYTSNVADTAYAVAADAAGDVAAKHVRSLCADIVRKRFPEPPAARAS